MDHGGLLASAVQRKSELLCRSREALLLQHRHECALLLKPGAIAALSLFGNPVKAIRIIHPYRTTPPRSNFEAHGTEGKGTAETDQTFEGVLPVPSTTCVES
jgi:hypothetical protein